MQVRDGETALPNLILTVKEDRSSTLVPALSPKTLGMQKTGAVSGGAPYSLYTVQYKLPVESWTTTFDLALGSGSSGIQDGFKHTGALGSCVRPSVHVSH